MATTRNSRHAPEESSEATTKITVNEWLRKEPNWAKTPLWALVFIIIVTAIVAVIHFIVVSNTMAVNPATKTLVNPYAKLSYPESLNAVAWWYNLVVLLPALVLLVLRRRHRFATVLIRLVAMAVSVVVFIEIMPAKIGIFVGIVRAMSKDVVIPQGMAVAMVIIALVAHAAFAALLCRYSPDDGSLSVNEQKLEAESTALREAEAKKRGVDSELESHRQDQEEAEEKARQQDEIVAEAGRKVEEARKKLSEFPANKDLAPLQKEADANNSRYEELKSQLKECNAELANPRLTPTTRTMRENERDELEAELAPLLPLFNRTNPDGYHLRLAKLQAEVDASDEKKELDAAIAAHQDATAEQTKLQQAVEASKAEVTTAERNANKAAGVVTAHEAEVTRLEDAIATARKEDGSVWRDAVAPLVLLLLLALSLYSGFADMVNAALR